LPDVPTVRETGVPGLEEFEAVGWLGLMAPAGTPADIVARVNREVVDLLEGEEMATLIRDKGSEPAPTTPGAFDAFVASEIDKWGAAVKASGASAD
jgi:tripartite-type tricarboxylate transporter receptor subunit TctC